MIIIVLSYSGIVALFSFFIFYFEIKYKRTVKANYYIGKKLDTIRGKVTILYPMKFFSYIFIISWLSLVMPWIDIFIETNFIASYENGLMYTYFGVFSSNQSDSYFITVFVSTLGANGFYLINRITNILCDDSLFIGNDSRLRYRRRVF